MYFHKELGRKLYKMGSKIPTVTQNQSIFKDKRIQTTNDKPITNNQISPGSNPGGAMNISE